MLPKRFGKVGLFSRLPKTTCLRGVFDDGKMFIVHFFLQIFELFIFRKNVSSIRVELVKKIIRGHGFIFHGKIIRDFFS